MASGSPIAPGSNERTACTEPLANPEEHRCTVCGISARRETCAELPKRNGLESGAVSPPTRWNRLWMNVSILGTTSGVRAVSSPRYRSNTAPVLGHPGVSRTVRACDDVLRRNERPQSLGSVDNRLARRCATFSEFAFASEDGVPKVDDTGLRRFSTHRVDSSLKIAAEPNSTCDSVSPELFRTQSEDQTSPTTRAIAESN